MLSNENCHLVKTNFSSEKLTELLLEDKLENKVDKDKRISKYQTDAI